MITVQSRTDVLSLPGLGERERKQLAELVRRLLARGGNSVRLPNPPVPFLAALLSKGRLLLPGSVILWPDQQRHCHGNAAKNWSWKEGKVRLATGYALTNNGIWRPHSWGVDSSPTEPGEEPCIHETTSWKKKYFGIILNRGEALKFWVANFLALEGAWPMELLAKRKDWFDLFIRFDLMLPD